MRADESDAIRSEAMRRKRAILTAIPAAVLAAALASCLVVDSFDDDDDDAVSCRDAIEKIYISCGAYFEDSTGAAFDRNDAIDACRDDDVFASWEWDCVRTCVADNERCVGVVDCVRSECEIENLVVPEDE
jgi:hypothetical protein